MRTSRFYWKQADTGNSLQFIMFLHQLHKANPNKKLMIILDNGSIHKSKKVQAFIKKHSWVELFYLPDEASVGWLTCIDEMFSKFEHATVLGNEVILEGFDLKGLQVVAKCRSGHKLALVSLESVEFPKLDKSEKLWLHALKDWNENF